MLPNFSLLTLWIAARRKDNSVTMATRTNENSGLYVEIPISNGNDDVEESGTDGAVDLSSSDLELVYDRNLTGNQTIGLRFDNSFFCPIYCG